VTDTVEAPAPRRRSPGFLVAAVLAVVFFASTILLGVVAAGLKADKDELTDGRAEVADVAGRFVSALLSYDHRDPEGFRQRVLGFTAPPFSEQFEEAAGELEATFEGLDAVSTPTIKEVFVAEIADGTATAIVVYDRVLDGISGPRAESNLYVRLGMVERDDGWRVNDVINLNLAFAGPTAGDATGGSTTTVPG
jgi:Mce-associated membrane protein